MTLSPDPERFQGFHGTPLSAKTHHILPRWLMQLKHMQGGEEGGGGGGGEEDAPANSHVDFIGRFQGFHGTPLSAKTHHILPRWLMQLKHMQGGEEGGGGGGGEKDAPANSHVDFIGQQSEGCSHHPLIPEGLVSMLLLFYAKVLPPFNIPMLRI